MCAECKRKEVYKFGLCEKCYGDLFKDSKVKNDSKKEDEPVKKLNHWFERKK